MQFPYVWRTKHLILHYGYRSPYDALRDPDGYLDPLLPLDGVDQFTYVTMVSSFFERAWKVYQDLELRLPVAPFPIYFQYLNPPLDGVTLPRGGGIVVKSQHEVPWGLGDIPTMQAVAAHELFHAVQERYPLKSGCENNWDWWVEATATFMEDIVFPGTIDYLKFLQTWFDEPSVPLYSLKGLSSHGPFPDQGPSDHHFGGVLFCRFLHQRFDLDLILDTWRRANQHRLPFEALQAILKSGRYGKPRPLASSQDPDLFGSEFLPANFFLSDSRYGYKDGALYEHFFQHAFVPRLLEVPTPKPHGGELYHLSAEYILVRPSKSSGSPDLTVVLGCRVDSDNPPSESPMKAVLIPMKMGRRAGEGTDIRLEPLGGGSFERQYTYDNFWWGGIDQALLIAVNTTWGENSRNSVQYELAVK